MQNRVWEAHIVISQKKSVVTLQQHYSNMPTTLGALAPPLGNTRLQIARMVATLVLTNTHSVNVELANLGTISTLLVRPFDLHGTSGSRISYFCLCVVVFSIVNCATNILGAYTLGFDFIPTGLVFQVLVEQFPAQSSGGLHCNDTEQSPCWKQRGQNRRVPTASSGECLSLGQNLCCAIYVGLNLLTWCVDFFVSICSYLRKWK